MKFVHAIVVVVSLFSGFAAHAYSTYTEIPTFPIESASICSKLTKVMQHPNPEHVRFQWNDFYDMLGLNAEQRQEYRNQFLSYSNQAVYDNTYFVIGASTVRAELGYFAMAVPAITGQGFSGASVLFGFSADSINHCKIENNPHLCDMNAQGSAIDMCRKSLADYSMQVRTPLPASFYNTFDKMLDRVLAD